MALCYDALNADACATRSRLPLQSRGVPCAAPMSLAGHGHGAATFLDECCFSERAMLLVLLRRGGRFVIVCTVESGGNK